MRYIIGTRGSALALAQSEQVRTLLQNTYPQHSFTVTDHCHKGGSSTACGIRSNGCQGHFVRK